MEDKKNKLLVYLETRGVMQQHFAKRIGVSGPTLRRYLNDLAKPSIDIAIKIEKETEGKVKVLDWADPKLKDAK